jgi:hypothetical protein
VGVAALGQAMSAYDGSLTQLDYQLLELRGSALALEAMAERAL